MNLPAWVKANYKQIWKGLKPFLLLALLVAFFYYIPVRRIWEAILSINIFLFFLSFLIGFLALYFVALKLWFFSKKQGLRFSPNKIFVMNLAVRFYSFFSPASLVGSGLKWYKLSSPGKETSALLAVAVSRVWDVFIVVLFGLIWLLLGTNVDFITPELLILLAFLLVLFWFLALRYSARLKSWLEQRQDSAQYVFVQKLHSFFGKLLESFSLYQRMSFADWMLLIGISVTVELVALIGHTVLAYALKIPISFVDLGWMRAIFFLSALAPFTLAGGVGLREASVVFVMSGFGIETELAVAYSFLLYARSVLLYLVGGIVELFSFFERKTA